MKLNIPDIPAFDANSHFFTGAGGGYDYLGCATLISALQEAGKKVAGVDLTEKLGRSGAIPIKNLLQTKVDEYQSETLIVVDGGVDSLMRGDEKDGGTLLEDSVTLAAVAHVQVTNKILVCMGFGTETEEGLCHYRALENIASLTAAGGFLGACALTPDMEAFKYYKEVCEWAWEGKRKSHIHTRIIPAVLGQFGEPTMYEGVDARLAGRETGNGFATPLMGLMWFFDLMKVYEHNLIAKALVKTTTSTDALMVYRQLLPDLMKKPRLSMPIPL